MESRAKLLGHPVHQMLIVFPLGLLAMAVIFDLLAIGVGNGYWSEISYWMIGAGVVTGLHRLHDEGERRRVPQLRGARAAPDRGARDPRSRSPIARVAPGSAGSRSPCAVIPGARASTHARS